MYALKFEVLCDIAGSAQKRYRGLAYDGRYFYLTRPQDCEIHVYDGCCKKIESISTCRAYDLLCYDLFRQEFWAGKSGGQHLYKLNRDLEETDCIPVKGNDRKSYLCSVCSGNARSLLIATPGSIAEVRKQGGSEPFPLREFPRADCAYVACGPGSLYWLLSNHQGDSIYFDAGDWEETYAMPGDYRADGIAAGDGNTLWILARKRYGHQCILKCTFLEEHDRDRCCESHRHEPCEAERRKPERPKPCRKPCPELCCEPCQKPCCEPCREPCKEPCCDPCWEPCSCCDPCCEPDCEKPCGANDIIESVALIETALSHILNAEGEKLQKVLATSDDVCEILTTNKSIRETISGITHLEHVLYDKLYLAGSMCNDHKRPPCR